MRIALSLRRVLRRALRRPKHPSSSSVTPALIPAFLLIFLILYHPPASLPQLLPPSHSFSSIKPIIRSPLSLPFSPSATVDYEPLRSRVDAIVGTGTKAREALLSVYRLPPPIVANMTQQIASRLYWKLVYADVVATLRAQQVASAHRYPVPKFQPDTRVFFIHAQNGLGNRLRALASGLAMARATKRVPVVVWETDPHLGASFHDLLDAHAFGSDVSTVLYSDLIIMDSFPPWHAIGERSDDWYPINYMIKDGGGAAPNTLMHFAFPLMPHVGPYTWVDEVGGAKNIWGEDDDFDESKVDKQAKAIRMHMHVYYKSAYVAVTEPAVLSDSQYVNRELMQLQPSKTVMEIFDRQKFTDLTKTIGIHIRSRTLENDKVNVDRDCEYTMEGMHTTNFWRKQAQVPTFVNQIQRIQRMRSEKNVKFFVAADNVDTIKQLKARFTGRILSVPRDCDGRDKTCVLYAMVDLLCLSRTRKIYGSYWSSFTEAAARMGNKKVFLSGVDFGKKRSVGTFTRRALGYWERTGRWVKKYILGYHVPAEDSPFADCVRRRS